MVDVRSDDRHTILERTRSQVDEPRFGSPRSYERRNYQELTPHHSHRSGALGEDDVMADQDPDPGGVDREELEPGTLSRPSLFPSVKMHLVLTRNHTSTRRDCLTRKVRSTATRLVVTS